MRWGIMLEGRPMMQVECRENLVDLWTRYMGLRKKPLVWKPLGTFAVDSRAIIGVRKLRSKTKRSTRVGFGT